MRYFVIGHRNPDTDSVISAIVFSFYLKRFGIEAEAVVCGKPNRETEFILKKFGQRVPRSLNRAPRGAKFYLVDHGGISQSLSELEEGNIVGVVDHHQMIGLNTTEPILYRCEPIGSTSSMVVKMFEEKGWRFNKKMASLLAAAIISDTLNLTSQTTTKEDRRILSNLGRLAKIDLKDLAKKIFKVKSDISGMNLKKVLLSDFKDYEHNGKKLGVGVFETVDAAPFNEKKEKIFSLLRKIKKEKGLDFLFFGSVDIIKKETFFYLLTNEEAGVARKAFGLPSGKAGEIMILKGVTSRKKQMLPFLLKSI